MFMFETVIIVKTCKVLSHMRQIDNRDIHFGCLDVTNGSLRNLNMTQ